MKINLQSLAMVLMISAVAGSSVEAKKRQPAVQVDQDEEDGGQNQKPARTWSQWASQKAAANLSIGNARIIANQKLQAGNAAVARQQAAAAKQKADKIAADAQANAEAARNAARTAYVKKIKAQRQKLEDLEREHAGLAPSEQGGGLSRSFKGGRGNYKTFGTPTE
jgi:hypothetical protein